MAAEELSRHVLRTGRCYCCLPGASACCQLALRLGVILRFSRSCRPLNMPLPMKISPNNTLLMIGDSITDCGRARPIAESVVWDLGNGYVSLVHALIGLPRTTSASATWESPGTPCVISLNAGNPMSWT